MKKHNNPNSRGESGVAMVVALVLLVAATLTALFTNRNLVFGVKSQANQIKSVMAQEAAMGGLEAALAVLAKKVNRENLLIGTPPPAMGEWYDGTLYGFFLDTSGTPDSLVDEVSLAAAIDGTVPAAPGGGVVISSFQARFTRLSAPATITDPDRAILINVLGCADGQTPSATACTSRAFATQSTVFKPDMVSAPSAALTAKGNVNLSGNVTITNTDAATNGTTIHAGGCLHDGTACTGDPSGSAELIGVPGTPENATYAENDSTISNLTDDQFFQGFFGASKENVKQNAARLPNDYPCSGTCGGAEILAAEPEGKVIWITGDAEINSSGVPLRSEGEPGAGSEKRIGSLNEPVIIIVDGELLINGNVTIYGVVYCTAITWNNTGGGTSQIKGAAISEGNFTATGTPNPTYNPDVLNNLRNNLGSYVRIPGGWKDWCNDCDFH